MRKIARNLGLLSVLALSGAAMAGGVAHNFATQAGIPPEVATVANYTHLGDLSQIRSDGGEPPVRGTIGPDVTVSQIGSTITRYGTINNVSSYAMTTVSCNIGDMNAIWIAGQAKHPLIAQNMYRYKTVDGAGRFEMIGMSWLKHGWCAADAPGSGCGSCNAPHGSCDWLGLNCSDTYGAGLNATQPDLGPRSEVNAFTATYPYPYIRSWNQSGDAIFKRLQIHNDDLNTALNPGAQYFAEVQYLCTDEAAWGTQYNNSSYRKASVSASGSNWIFAFNQGATVEERQVLDAWQVIDPAVTLINAQVPGEGRFTLGYRVTDLGNGTWRYEYALQNYNSDRSGGSFSVPIPDGVNVTNIGFHDVFYHSGEPYVGTDWTGAVSNGVLTWSTEAYATNPDANALRWSTTYNFRFDADVAPADGNVTLGLFKPGTPTSIDIAAAVPAGTSCDADFDGSGDLTLADFVAFRNAYTAGDLAADFDGDGLLTLNDFVSFRNAYTAGCP